ncbi:hypothetical protein JQC72_00090 [Polycladomyces sp. WAk]|uniref:Uncharacterized protein n=1 Tax=Polycladomyces zharkentensis TaxID=2807616 RepID=A0ABS2WEP7_9BACL|nr:hypothetical protein [Polycladomyces sp. WAk]MBN2907919.1 hypothetical protein [Polycladomyces sp. WAk]
MKESAKIFLKRFLQVALTSFLFGVIAFCIQLVIRYTIWLVTIIEDFSLRKLWRTVSQHDIVLFVWVLVFVLVFLPLYLLVFLLLDQCYGRKRGALLYSLVGVVLCFVPAGIFTMQFQHPPNFFHQFRAFHTFSYFVELYAFPMSAGIAFGLLWWNGSRNGYFRDHPLSLNWSIRSPKGTGYEERAGKPNLSGMG